MQIAEVEAIPIAIPLETPVSFATRTLRYRDHAVTYIRTESGHEGVGWTLGYESADLIADVVNGTLAPMIEGEDPRDVRRLYRQMTDGTVQIGRRGAVMRAISTVDIACWDVAATAAETPLHKYLGAARDAVPSYASGGYYRDEKGHSALREEVNRYTQAGHDAVKMKVGRLSVSEEIERVRAVREELGADRTLLMDANGAWDSAPEALRFCRAAADYNPYFIEEPAMPDNIDLLARINDSLDYSVATGELESTRYGFATLIRAGAADILQPDVTVVGGITEWIRVANTAAARDIPIAPHYVHNLHTPLLCTVDNATWIEYFYRDQDVVVFDEVVKNPLTPDAEGMMRPNDRPGHGIELDRDAIAQYRSLPDG
ncbi:MAG: mandelate racemase/muconate lactonizing enzyme family protein [Salinirussus sp.]